METAKTGVFPLDYPANHLIEPKSGAKSPISAKTFPTAW